MVSPAWGVLFRCQGWQRGGLWGQGLHLLAGWLLQTGGGGTLHRGRGGLLVTAG